MLWGGVFFFFFLSPGILLLSGPGPGGQGLVSEEGGRADGWPEKKEIKIKIKNYSQQGKQDTPGQLKKNGLPC